MTNKAKKKELSIKQKTKLLMTKCKTKAELNNWIKYHMGMHLPDCTVSRYSDINPLDVVWQLYDICVNRNNTENIEELLIVAARGSGKTLSMAIAELMIMLHDQRDVVHVGAILSQAKRCYDYQIKFMLNDRMKTVLNADPYGTGPILEKANMEKSTFNLKGNYTTLEILPCTLKACLTADNIIETTQGKKAISDITLNDSVASPIGPAKLIDTKHMYKECMEVVLQNGIIIRGTLDHKIWTNKGWVELQHLTKEHDIIVE